MTTGFSVTGLPGLPYSSRNILVKPPVAPLTRGFENVPKSPVRFGMGEAALNGLILGGFGAVIGALALRCKAEYTAAENARIAYEGLPEGNVPKRYAFLSDLWDNRNPRIKAFAVTEAIKLPVPVAQKIPVVLAALRHRDERVYTQGQKAALYLIVDESIPPQTRLQLRTLVLNYPLIRTGSRGSHSREAFSPQYEVAEALAQKTAKQPANIPPPPLPMLPALGGNITMIKPRIVVGPTYNIYTASTLSG
jgi:hypothetical protein